MQIAVETTINAPPQLVFQTAADIANWSRFISAIQSVEVLTPGPFGAGTRFRETRTMFGKAATEEMTVAEIEPPRRFLLTAFNHGTAYRAEHTFDAEGAGTRAGVVFEGQPVALAARLFAWLGHLFAGSVRRQLEGDLADLKREAERRHGAGARRP